MGHHAFDVIDVVMDNVYRTDCDELRRRLCHFLNGTNPNFRKEPLAKDWSEYRGVLYRSMHPCWENTLSDFIVKPFVVTVSPLSAWVNGIEIVV